MKKPRTVTLTLGQPSAVYRITDAGVQSLGGGQ